MKELPHNFHLKKLWSYGMRLRGFAPFCQPSKGLVSHRDADKATEGFWSILTYDRELTDSEIREYELTPLEY